ncbi:hypothetical protein Tco_0982840, partial [Tanacetum coccineum]
FDAQEILDEFYEGTHFLLKIATNTPIETNKALVKEEETEAVDVHLYRSMIGSLMYLIASRPDIRFAICASARFQVTPKTSHIHAVKRIFRYLKGQPKLGLWYPRDLPFDLDAFSDSDYDGASLDRKSTIGGYQFLRRRLISWQCKKQTIVANSTTETEYVAAANCCGQSSGPIHLVADKTVYKEWEERMERATTTASSLETEKESEENAEFHQIVDFLTTSSIHYALTVSPTIYASYIEQFWNTANSQTVNDVKQIHATVDGKTVVISESSVRSDLHFNDEDALFSPQWKYLIHTILHCLSSKSTSWNEFSTNIASAVICLATGQKFNFSKLIFDEPFNDTYETPKHTKKVFTNMKRKGNDFSRRVTLLFASMLAPPVVRGEGLGQPSKPQPPSSTTQPIIEEQIPTSVPIPNLADEAIFKEKDDIVVRATTTDASLDAARASGDRHRCQEAIGVPLLRLGLREHLPGVNTPKSDEERNEQQDLTDFVPPTPHDSPLSGGHTLGSDEGRPNINELMVICINLSNRVLALEQSKTAQDLVLQKKVKRLEKALRARTPRYEAFKTGIGPHGEQFLDKENVSKQGRKSDKTKPMFKDSDFEELGNIMENVEGGSVAERITTARDTLNTASYYWMDVDELLAARLQEQEREQFSVDEHARFLVETIAARKKFFFAALESSRDFIKQNRTTTQNSIRKLDDYLSETTMAVHSQSVWKGRMIASRSEGRSVRKDKSRHDERVCQGIHEIQDDAKKEKLRAYLVIVQGDDIAIDVESLATKYPIVDWKTHILTKNMMYYQIIRADGSSKNYKIFSEMLDDFDRQDVMDLHRLVKERYDTTSPEGYDLLLWGDLKTLFEPCEEDEVWRNQQGYNLISWRLFDSCGVHVLLMDNGIAIHMMIEKKYPLTQEMLSRMLNRRLEVDHESEMAFELLRFTRSQLKK